MANPAWWRDTVVLGQQIPEYDIPPDFARSEVSLCKRIGAETFLMFIQTYHGGEYVYPSSFAPTYRRLRGRDLLAEVLAECKEKGLRFVAGFFGMHGQGDLARQHPTWVFRDLAQSQDRRWRARSSSVLCLNSPYRRLLQSVVREVLERYEVDGIYFDGVYYPPRYCFCPACRRKYRATFGRAMPMRLRDENRLKLGEESVVSWAKEIRRIIDRVRPETCYAQDCHGTIIGATDCRELVHRTAEYIDVFIQECYPEIVGEQPYYAEMENRLIAAETGKTVWWTKWIPRDPCSYHNMTSNPPAAIRLWGAGALAQKSPPWLLSHRVQEYDRRSVRPMRDVARIWRRSRPSMTDARSVASVALLHSVECRDRRMPAGAREIRRYLEGWYLTLRSEHILFDVIAERDLADATTRNYDVLVLPNVRYVSDGVIEAIRRFAAAGGALVATGYSSLSDEAGRDRRDFGLSDLLGTSFAGDVCYGDYDGLHRYYATISRHPIARGLEGNLYCFSSGLNFPRVRLRDASAIFMTMGYDSRLRRTNDERYFASFAHGKPRDVVLAVRDGPIRAIHIPVPLDAVYWEFGWPETREIMRNAVLWALKGRPELTTDADENLWYTLYRNDERRRWVLHVHNHGVNNQYAVGFGSSEPWDPPGKLTRGHPVRACYPTAPFSVTLRIPHGARLNAASLTGKKIALERVREGWRIRHPGIREYDVIVLTEGRRTR